MCLCGGVCTSLCGYIISISNYYLENNSHIYTIWTTDLKLNVYYNFISCHTSEPVKLLSRVWLFAIPWTVAYQAPPSMEFSRQEYWSGLPFLSPGDLPDPGINPRSPTLQAGALLSELTGKPPVILQMEYYSLLLYLCLNIYYLWVYIPFLCSYLKVLFYFSCQLLF